MACCTIDPTFVVSSDTPAGCDPDTWSPTLAKYHYALWRKPLPNGELLDFTMPLKPPFRFYCENVGMYLSSDTGATTYTLYKRNAHIIVQVPEVENAAFRDTVYTIGSFIVFPSKQNSINQARGRNGKICDRFDLTIECIRLHYAGEDSPLADVLQRDAAWFALFGDFKGYVQFFHLQDLVTDDLSAVRFFSPFTSFEASPLFAHLDAYLDYRSNAIQFVRARGERMAASMLSKGDNK